MIPRSLLPICFLSTSTHENRLRGQTDWYLLPLYLLPLTTLPLGTLQELPSHTSTILRARGLALLPTPGLRNSLTPCNRKADEKKDHLDQLRSLKVSNEAFDSAPETKQAGNDADERQCFFREGGDLVALALALWLEVVDGRDGLNGVWLDCGDADGRVGLS